MAQRFFLVDVFANFFEAHGARDVRARSVGIEREVLVGGSVVLTVRGELA